MDYLYLGLQVLAPQFFPFRQHFFLPHAGILINEALNVLSFPSTTEIYKAIGIPKFEAHVDPFELGNIAIAYEVCKKEADISEIDFEHHVYHLIIHSLLHLLGYDHEEEKKAAEMEKIEVQVLAKLGISNPYSCNL